MKCQLKPKNVDAIQFDGTQESFDAITVMGDGLRCEMSFPSKVSSRVLSVCLGENNWKHASVGEWVVKSTLDKWYVLSDKAFKNAYEPIEIIPNPSLELQEEFWSET